MFFSIAVLICTISSEMNESEVMRQRYRGRSTGWLGTIGILE